MSRNAMIAQSRRPVAVREPEVIDLQPLPNEPRRRRFWRALFVVLGWAALISHATTMLLGLHPFLQ